MRPEVACFDFKSAVGGLRTVNYYINKHGSTSG